MNDFAAILHGSPATDPDRPVIVPGEIELSNMARHQRDGIAVDPVTLNLLRRYAAQADE